MNFWLNYPLPQGVIEAIIQHKEPLGQILFVVETIEYKVMQ